MLIRNAEIFSADYASATLARVDVRIEGSRIAAIAPAGQSEALRAGDAEACLDAGGALLLPGLHDHHIHLVSLAVAQQSIPCGPPEVHTEAELAARLQAAAAQLAPGQWLRGFGYHATVAGDIDRHWLDRLLPRHPVRIQQRSGRLWLLNSAALAQLTQGLTASQLPAGLERQGGVPSGRLYDADAWLAQRLAHCQVRRFPDLSRVSQLLAGQGVTGVCDTTPANDCAQWQHFAAQAGGALSQQLLLMGDASLDALAGAGSHEALTTGPLKLHLHDNALPDFDPLVAAIARSHAHERPVAIHCVTVTELVFALNALAAAGRHAGDRIEHAAVVPPDMLELLAASAATVVTQPNFIHERGDVYRQEVAAEEQPWLYRLQGLRAAGIPLAGSSDAPFGRADPWAAMQAAVERRSAAGVVMGADEALSPEAALALFLAPLAAPGAPPRRVTVAAAADLCLIDRPWAQARRDLAAVGVTATWRAGRLVAGAAGGSAAIPSCGAPSSPSPQSL